ncbi:MAG TPA: SHOCT domain-containing protein [Baekduia sp.]|nr:SHOCT domain-containing protein [Baekduia sp.]
MIIAADYPFLDILGTMLVFFFWVMWFWCLIVVLTDVFSRQDLSGWSKAGWTVLCIVLPLLGVLVYLVAHGSDMGERRAQEVDRQRSALDEHIRSVAASGGADGGATQIAQAKELLDRGAIDQQEYDELKRKALA